MSPLAANTPDRRTTAGKRLARRNKIRQPIRGTIQTRRRHCDPRPPQMRLRDTIRDLRNAHDGRIPLPDKLIQPRHLIAGQPERITHNLLMDIPLQLKDNPTDRHPTRPVIEAAFSFPHSALVAGREDADVRADARVEPVFHAAQALADRLFAVAQLCGADSPVVVQEPDPVFAPDEGCAACAAAGVHVWPPFLVFAAGAGFGEEPILLGLGC